MKVKHDAPGMKGQRSRNQDGELRQKRSDTKVETIEKQYGIDLHVRGDMQIGTYLDREGIPSLNDLVHKK
jgi:hypothetical protein